MHSEGDIRRTRNSESCLYQRFQGNTPREAYMFIALLALNAVTVLLLCVMKLTVCNPHAAALFGVVHILD